jgi:hypothetical protein
MSITVRFGPGFSEYTNDQESIRVTGSTVKECLDNLMRLLPVFRTLLFDQSNMLSALIMYRGEVIVQKQLDRPVADRQEIIILPMVYGG